ncbi:hypothetical protein DL762_001998 [Monosporascus cannonballus]|uniref:GRF-like zinc ribbon domain-containing protein n=1 Tax=Monosporascus cannonballus TaxID=155416 RepID=A0ABY0HG15_9PEZI|nr:hypothetical protein DL762_001998 [Monosporascus cannonballus]
MTSSLEITRSSNRNGNVGRPYFKCHSCDKFIAFDDPRGADPANPECHCGVASRRQVTGRYKTVPRNLHYVCRLGTCDFYDEPRDEQGGVVVVAEELINILARLSIV